MPKDKSIFEVRYHTLLGAILSSFVVVGIYIYSMAEGSHTLESTSPLGGYVSQWGVEHPILSYIILSVVVLYISINIAQTASRFRLYGVTTHLPMELFPMLLLLSVGGGIVEGGIVMLLLLSVIKNLFSSYRATNRAGALSLGALSLGAMPLIYPPSIVLWVVVPPMLIIFERTLREVVITLFSLAVPLFSYIYIKWMLGGLFMEELHIFFDSLVNCEAYSFWRDMSVVRLVAYMLVVVALVLSTVAIFQLDNTVKARRRLVLASLFAFAGVGMFLIPASNIISLRLLALPLAMLMPVMMLRVGRMVAFGLYVLLLIVGLMVAFWQYIY